MENESINDWLSQLKAGDSSAAQPIWERYFARLVTLARLRLSGRRVASDEEDVALSAFDSFCRGATSGRFPRLDDRDDLWRVLVVIVTRKALDHAKHEQRLKRGGKRGPVEVDWGSILSTEPTPAFAAELAEQFEILLTSLNDETLRQIALWKMEGYNIVEISKKLECGPRTVERKLRLIRAQWNDEKGFAAHDS